MNVIRTASAVPPRPVTGAHTGVSACDSGVCGENANCNAINHRAQCTCPPDFLGDAYTRCYTECTRHDDCSRDKACVRLKCRDPCYDPNPNVCGQSATCATLAPADQVPTVGLDSTDPALTVPCVPARPDTGVIPSSAVIEENV